MYLTRVQWDSRGELAWIHCDHSVSGINPTRTLPVFTPFLALASESDILAEHSCQKRIDHPDCSHWTIETTTTEMCQGGVEINIRARIQCADTGCVVECATTAQTDHTRTTLDVRLQTCCVSLFYSNFKSRLSLSQRVEQPPKSVVLRRQRLLCVRPTRSTRHSPAVSYLECQLHANHPGGLF